MHFKKILAGLTLTVASAVASAAPWTQTLNFTPDRVLQDNQSTTWTHDLSLVGFDAGFDSITSFSLTVGINDVGNVFDLLFNTEDAAINLPGGTSPDQTWSNVIGVNTYSGSQIGGLVTLNANGQLTVTLSSTNGSFAVDYSTLTANGKDGVVTPPTSKVPEPGALALAGLGLVALGLRRRSQRKD